jgi:hypothetical protein
MVRSRKTQANKVNVMLPDGLVTAAFIHINAITGPSIENVLIVFCCFFFPRDGQLMFP